MSRANPARPYMERLISFSRPSLAVLNQTNENRVSPKAGGKTPIKISACTRVWVVSGHCCIVSAFVVEYGLLGNRRPIMDNLSVFCCLNPACADLGKRGHGNLTVTARYGPNNTKSG